MTKVKVELDGAVITVDADEVWFENGFSEKVRPDGFVDRTATGQNALVIKWTAPKSDISTKTNYFSVDEVSRSFRALSMAWSK